MSEFPKSISNSRQARLQRARDEAREQRRKEAAQRREEARQRRERDAQQDWCVVRLRAGETLHVFGWGDVAVEAGAVRIDDVALAADGPCTRLRIAAPFCEAATSIRADASEGAVLRFSRAAGGHAPSALLRSPFAAAPEAPPHAPPADPRVRTLMTRLGVTASPVRVLDRHVPELYVVTKEFLDKYVLQDSQEKHLEKNSSDDEKVMDEDEQEEKQDESDEETEQKQEGEDEQEQDEDDEEQEEQQEKENILIILPQALDKETEGVLDEIVAEAREGAQRVLVAGARRVGKTTLARTLANRLLQEAGGAVAWLECDPAQPEFAPRGLLALTVLDAPVHGPAYARARRPAAAAYHHSVPAAGGVDAPVFLRAVHALLERYDALRRDAARRGTALHLVVHTQGWLLGTGYESLLALARMAAPHHALALVPRDPVSAAAGAGASGTPSETHMFRPADARALADAGTRVHVLASPVPPVAPHTLAMPGSAREREHAHLRCYFNDHVDPLLCAPAYRVPFAALTLVPVGTVAHTLVPDDVFRALNGMLVALGTCDPACFVAKEPAAPAQRDMPRLVLPPPDTLSFMPPLIPCVGLAIVRSINVAQRYFELICPFNPVCFRSFPYLLFFVVAFTCACPPQNSTRNM